LPANRFAAAPLINNPATINPTIAARFITCLSFNSLSSFFCRSHPLRRFQWKRPQEHEQIPHPQITVSSSENGVTVELDAAAISFLVGTRVERVPTK
jgi:phage-related protein